MIKVDAMGDACPIPVVKTKNAIKELKNGGQVETLVDNEIAVQNLTKMAEQKGYVVSSEQIGENAYKVTMTVEKDSVPEGTDADTNEEEAVCAPIAAAPKKKNTVVVISKDHMGEGAKELGQSLLKGFIYALSQQDVLPDTVLFYNGGAYMTCEDSPALEDLKYMAEQGVEILTCGACLNYYGLTEKLAVGEVTNMYVICEKMTGADLVVKP